MVKGLYIITIMHNDLFSYQNIPHYPKADKPQMWQFIKSATQIGFKEKLVLKYLTNPENTAV